MWVRIGARWRGFSAAGRLRGFSPAAGEVPARGCRCASGAAAGPDAASSASDAPYGFGAASGRDRVVWASGRPGGPSPPGSVAGLISPASVNAWIDHVWAVAGEDVRRVLVLLGDDEVRQYERPLLVHLFRHDFAVARVGALAAVPPRGGGDAGSGGDDGEEGRAADEVRKDSSDRGTPGSGLVKVLKALRTAEASGEGMVAVCGDGGLRGAHTCAAWLWYRYGLDPGEACAEVARRAEADGCPARARAAADIDAFRVFLGGRTRESLFDHVDRHGLREPPP